GLQGFVSPESFILVESVTILAMVVLGGMGSIPGVVVGALILTVLPEVLREYAQYRFTIFGLGLTFMVLVRPQGLWPAVHHAEPPGVAGGPASPRNPRGGPRRGRPRAQAGGPPGPPPCPGRARRRPPAPPGRGGGRGRRATRRAAPRPPRDAGMPAGGPTRCTG